MAQSTNTGYAVIVLGDAETAARADLEEKAAEQGAVIAETYSFGTGEAIALDDLTEIAPVIEALSRAITTRTDVWVPFPIQDFGREAHVRRVSLVLQRHGLNMLIGRELQPCTTDGGYNEIDYALRAEVRAVDGLDHAVIAGAAVSTLSAEIERALAPAGTTVCPAPPDEPRPDDDDRLGERYYSTGEVAKFFGKSAQWVYWAMRTGVFVRPDGTPIEPLRIGRSGRRRFTVPVLREMARACYRRGILAEEELLDLLSVLSRAEQE